jgi:hypothetical protein
LAGVVQLAEPDPVAAQVLEAARAVEAVNAVKTVARARERRTIGFFIDGS